MDKNAKIYVAGHRGLVGSAIVRCLQKDGYTNLIYKTQAELDLLDQKATLSFFEKEKPEYVFLAAAKVGGIMAAFTAPAQFMYENVTIQNNVIHSAYLTKVKKLLFLGSSCIYPKFCPQPIKEEYLMTGPLEPTNASMAMGKIAGIYTCQSYNKQYGTNYISVMPCNQYGPNDNFDLEKSHVLPSLMRKFHEAKVNNTDVTLWGTGSPRREFLYVDDLADACIFLMNNYNSSEIINIGSGTDLTVKELADMMKKLVGFEGKIIWDKTKPNGTPQKLLDVTKLHSLGWKHKINLEEGIAMVYEWYKSNKK